MQGQTDSYVYTYDARGRLTDVTKNGAPSGHWAYDARLVSTDLSATALSA